jgi:hypothetical protein
MPPPPNGDAMPTATTAPVSPLARLKAAGKLAPLPEPSASDLARWARSSSRRALVTDDAPDLGDDVPGMIACVDVDSFPIPKKTAAWFRAHGGTRTLIRALRQYMTEHAHDTTSARRRASPAPAKRRASR